MRFILSSQISLSFLLLLLLLLVARRPASLSLSLKKRAKWNGGFGGKKGKKREKRLHSFIPSPGFVCFRTNARTQRYARHRQKEREREGRVANHSSFCGLVRETRAFCLRKEREKESSF